MVCLKLLFEDNNINGDFMKKKTSRALTVILTCAVCLSVYMILGVLVLSPSLFEAKGKPEPVEDTRLSGDISILLSCEELSHYAALYADFDNNYISVSLFNNREIAENYGFEYDRYIDYSREAEVNLIGWLEGIVIDEKICYNDYNCELLSQGERVFGVRAVELSLSDPELRAAVAYNAIRGVLMQASSERDFIFLLGLCESDISYSDFYRFFPALSKLSDNITISIVG